MSSTRIWDAVVALNDKIKVAAPTATPEELAYLGTAIEKIGGHVTLIDLANHSDTIKADLDTHKASTLTSFQQTLNTKIADADTLLLSLKEAYVGVINSTTAPAISTVTTAVNAKLLDAQLVIGQLQDAIAQASSAAAAITREAPMTEIDAMFFSSF